MQPLGPLYSTLTWLGYPAATASIWELGSAWYASLHTVYSFLPWENLIISLLFVFLCWFMLLLPKVRKGVHEDVDHERA